jgi:hypothetical protein
MAKTFVEEIKYSNTEMSWKCLFYSDSYWVSALCPLSSTIKVGTHCNVTVYRNTVLWQCGRDSWPRHVSKVRYAVTLQACSVCCWNLTFASKGWYGYSLSRSGLATWQVTTVPSSRLLYIHDASGSRNKLGTPWCDARRILLRHEAQDESSDRNSVSCQSLAMLQRYSMR